jgi:segregation and condensation protein A
MSSYQVTLDVYEGPLDVLLRLIERQELDIALVSLALVADQFLEHVARLKEVSAGNLADFLVIAARLLVLKSRVLLPRSDEDEEEEEEWEEDLVERLRQYKRYKEAAARLREIEECGLRCYPREVPSPKLEARLLPGDATLDELVAALRRVLAAHPPTPPVDDVVAPVVIHISACIRTIQSLIQRYPRLRFATLMRRARSRMEVIVTFMAMLELIKQQRLRVTQERSFGEIYLQAREPDPEAEIAPLDLSEYGEGEAEEGAPGDAQASLAGADEVP